MSHPVRWLCITSWMVNKFYDVHKGETCLLVGNGSNLLATPPEWFDCPSFGLNTIHLYKGWKPDYYVAVDYVLYEEFGAAINTAFPDIPKFVPTPTADKWTGENFYRFPKKTGDIKLPRRENVLKDGFVYYNVMNAAMVIAWHMGFTRMLMIGVEQKQGAGELAKHFWGVDELTPASQTDEHWNLGYSGLIRAFTGIEVLNISENTYVPETVLPRDDWRKYAKVTA